MATIKSYTDLEQSRKLAEILPLESADMFYRNNGIDVKLMWEHNAQKVTDPCWSLAALLDVLPSATLDSSDDHHFRLRCMEKFTEWHDNAIDTCVEMIEKLLKQMIYDFNNS